MTYLEKVSDLYHHINTGKLMDGFEKYYHPNVVMQELGEAAREGKDANRVYEMAFLESIKEFHGSGVMGITSNETDHKTMVESWMEVTFQNGHRIKMEQVASQTWEGDHIIHETFYHK